MTRRWTTTIFLAAVVLVPVTLFSMISWYQSDYSPLPVLSPGGESVGAFSLRDQHGNNFSREDWNGKIVVANYFFTHCPQVCPKMAVQLKRVQERYPEVIICSFSVDPERDSVSRLREYAGLMNIGSNWHLLTGDKKALYRFARKELRLVATDGDCGPADFIHSENLVLVDTRGRIRGYYRGTDKDNVDQLIKDISKI